MSGDATTRGGPRHGGPGDLRQLPDAVRRQLKRLDTRFCRLLYQQSGLPLSGVAAELDMSTAKVQRTLRACGISLRPRGATTHKLPPGRQYRMARERLLRGTTYADLARRYGVTVPTVMSTLRRAGVVGGGGRATAP